MPAAGVCSRMVPTGSRADRSLRSTFRRPSCARARSTVEPTRFGTVSGGPRSRASRARRHVQPDRAAALRDRPFGRLLTDDGTRGRIAGHVGDDRPQFARRRGAAAPRSIVKLITRGTRTSEPSDSTRRTVAPGATGVPAAGDWPITVPPGSVPARCTRCTLRPASRSRAASKIIPCTSGIAIVGAVRTGGGEAGVRGAAGAGACPPAAARASESSARSKAAARARRQACVDSGASAPGPAACAARSASRGAPRHRGPAVDRRPARWRRRRRPAQARAVEQH